MCMLQKVHHKERLILAYIPFGTQVVIHDERVPCLHYMAPKEPHPLFQHPIPCQLMFPPCKICADDADVLTFQHQGR